MPKQWSKSLPREDEELLEGCGGGRGIAIETETCKVPVGVASESIDGTAEEGVFFGSGGDDVVEGLGR